MQGFALKENWADKFAGGSLARRDGTTLNVGEQLDDTTQTVDVDGEQLAVKKGYIVAADDQDAELLLGYEPLKQVPVKEAARAAKTRSAGSKESD